jgi:transposase
MEQVDGIRLREFRQVKREIRGSDQYLIVGIDVAKERHNAFSARRTARRCTRD